MATEVMKVEMEAESCCVCGSSSGELLSPEEHDAGAALAQVPLRAMLLHLNNSKVVPEGRLCSSCIRRTLEAYEFSTALASRGVPPLSEKIRALRRRLHELTQKIDVFIVVGGPGVSAGGVYSEDDIIMVDKHALATAARHDDDDLERARNARGDHVYQCTVCPASFARVAEYRAHGAAHGPAAAHACWTCGAAYGTRAALRDHAASHAAAALRCHLCERGFASGAELRRHEPACEARCPACGRRAADRAALAAHAAAAHGRAAPPPHVCPACFRTYRDAELFAAHLLRHRQARQFVCGYDGCILRFATRNNLMAHIRKCHASELQEGADAPDERLPPSTTCDECGRTFGSVAAMKRHARVHRRAQAQEEGTESQPEEEHMEIEEDGDESHTVGMVAGMGTGAGAGEGEPDGEVEYLEMESLDDMDDEQKHRVH